MSQHFVGFVKNQILQLVELQRTALQMVEDSPRRSDKNVDTLFKTAELLGVGLATVNRGYREGFGSAKRGNFLANLNCELPGRSQNKSLDVADSRGEFFNQREGKSGCLAGSGLGLPDEVDFSGQKFRDDQSLNGGGFFKPFAGEGLKNRTGKA